MSVRLRKLMSCGDFRGNYEYNREEIKKEKSFGVGYIVWLLKYLI